MAHNLDPLVTILDEIIRPTDQQDRRMKPLESLLEKVTSLKTVLENTSRLEASKNEIEALQIEIRDAAHEAEDIIESHYIVHGSLISPPGQLMSKLMEKFDGASEKLTTMSNDRKRDEDEIVDVVNPPLSAADHPTSSKQEITLVGFDDDVCCLKDRLTSERAELVIIPIVGMCGMGKTTLARYLYSDPLVVYHFQARAWVTVSQDYSVRALLLGLLHCLFGRISDEMLRENDGGLGLILYQSLYGKRYLIVLDDLWIKRDWDEIKKYFPNQSNRSRILITSRHFRDPAHMVHQMNFLTSDQSWDLFLRKVFGNAEPRCPPFLEGIGRKIVSVCRGLPLAITVIGGILSADKDSKDLWEQVAKDVRSVIISDHYERVSKILTLSYDNLPLHLKSCCLYMSAFPEDFSVRGSKLVKLWIAEGFVVRSNGSNKRLEDLGHEYLKALVDRNLFSVTHIKPNGIADSYTMHDILRDLCVRKADEEKFLLVVKKETVSKELRFSRRVSIHCPHYCHIEHASALGKYMALSRSLLFVGGYYETSGGLSHMFVSLRLLRVLDAYDIRFRKFPIKVTWLVNLRFLAFTCEEVLSSKISRLRNLQTLIVRIVGLKENVFPYKAWEIPGLRHVKLKNSHIFINDKIQEVLEKLQTIYQVDLRSLLVSDLLGNIPNIKKLGIVADNFDEGDMDVIDLSRLCKLETLRLSCCVKLNRNAVVLSLLVLPRLLKKVYLSSCTIPLRFMESLGSLQYLEVLRIRHCEFESREWEETEGDTSFGSLQYLLLEHNDMVSWRACDGDFPRLRHLVIGQCDVLKEVPTNIGDALDMIEVDESNAYLLDWAKEIQETQFDYGNVSLQVRFFPRGSYSYSHIAK